MVEQTINTGARTLTAEEQAVSDAAVLACKLSDVDTLYDTTCAACTHLGYTWQADRQGAGAIVAKHHFLEGTPPANTTWVDAGNTIRTLTWADFVSLKDRLFAFHEDAFTQKHTHRNAIEALGDTASVDAYDITTGWPT